MGAVSHEGPTKEVAENTRFIMTVVGHGWSERQAEPMDNPQSAPDKAVTVKVSGMNPGYGATATLLVWSAVTIIKENDKMPNK